MGRYDNADRWWDQGGVVKDVAVSIYFFSLSLVGTNICKLHSHFLSSTLGAGKYMNKLLKLDQLSLPKIRLGDEINQREKDSNTLQGASILKIDYDEPELAVGN